jgi:hypothetical protein
MPTRRRVLNVDFDRMKPHRVLVAASTILGLYLAGCFGNTSGGAQRDGGALPGEDSGIAKGDDGGSDAAGEINLPTTAVDLGKTDCGGKPATKTYSFENTGPVSVTWSAAVDSIFAIQGASSGTLAPGAGGSLTIGAAAVPATSTAGTAITGTLTITTNVPGFTSVKVPLQLTAQGGTLVLTPSTVGVGTVSVGSTGSLPFSLENTGNAPVDVTFGAPTDSEFTLSYTGAPASATIAPGATLLAAGVSFTPTGAGAKTATAAIQTTSALCASTLTAIPLSGTGTAVPLSIGPNPLDFGTTSCGKAAAAQQVTIKSTYSATAHFTAALGKGASSPYAIDTSSGSVASNASVAINVSPAAIPVPGDITADAYDDALTITTDIPGATPVVVSIKQSASGAILTPTMASTAFGSVGTTPASLPFVVTNSGNADATVSTKVTGGGFGASISGSDKAAASGGTVDGNATFTAQKSGNVTGTLAVTSSDPVCNVPPTLDLTATGALPVASFPSTSAIPLSGVCGGNVTGGTLVVQNTGTAALTIANVASKAGLFTATVAPASVAPGSSATITLTPSLPAGAQGGTSAGDTLLFSTNEPGGPSYSVPVSVAYHGANLSWSSGAVTVGPACGQVATTFTNTGDMAASVYVGGPYPQDGAFNFNGKFPSTAPGVSVGPGGSSGDLVGRNYGVASCSNGVACIYSGSESYVTLGSTGTTAGVCLPLPPLGLSMDYPSCEDCC